MGREGSHTMETAKLLLLHPQSRRICRLNEKLRKSGIDIIGDIPWETHFCQFYQTEEDLMDMLISYFKAGLERIWNIELSAH